MLFACSSLAFLRESNNKRQVFTWEARVAVYNVCAHRVWDHEEEQVGLKERKEEHRRPLRGTELEIRDQEQRQAEAQRNTCCMSTMPTFAEELRNFSLRCGNLIAFLTLRLMFLFLQGSPISVNVQDKF